VKSWIFSQTEKVLRSRYAEKITEQVIHSDLKNVALNNGLTDEQAWSMVRFIANLAETNKPRKIKKIRDR
jgi:hypothetical protein